VLLTSRKKRTSKLEELFPWGKERTTPGGRKGQRDMKGSITKKPVGKEGGAEKEHVARILVWRTD